MYSALDCFECVRADEYNLGEEHKDVRKTNKPFWNPRRFFLVADSWPLDSYSCSLKASAFFVWPTKTNSKETEFPQAAASFLHACDKDRPQFENCLTSAARGYSWQEFAFGPKTFPNHLLEISLMEKKNTLNGFVLVMYGLLRYIKPPPLIRGLTQAG